MKIRNIGTKVVGVNNKVMMPDDEMEFSDAVVNTPGFKALMNAGILKILDESKPVEEKPVEKPKAKKKAEPKKEELVEEPKAEEAVVAEEAKEEVAEEKPAPKKKSTTRKKKAE